MKYLLPILILCCALSPREKDLLGHNSKFKIQNSKLITSTNLVQVVTSSILVNGTNYQTSKWMLESQAANIVIVPVTNPPTPPKLNAQISWNTSVAILTSTNLKNFRLENLAAEVRVSETISNAAKFYRVPASITAEAVTLSWDPSPSPEVVGYDIWYGSTQSGIYTTTRPAPEGQMEMVITELAPGATYWFACTARNELGESSEFSNEVSYTVPLAAPPVAKIKLIAK